MNTIEISKVETLDHVLVQCLRLFAQRGRMVRNQEQSSDEHTLDSEMTKTASNDANEEDDKQR